MTQLNYYNASLQIFHSHRHVFTELTRPKSSGLCHLVCHSAMCVWDQSYDHKCTATFLGFTVYIVVNCQLWAVCFHWCILYGAKSAADICDTGDNTASHSASVKPSDQRRVTSAEFVEHLTHLMQKFPNGLPLSDLAAEYKVPWHIHSHVTVVLWKYWSATAVATVCSFSL